MISQKRRQTASLAPAEMATWPSLVVYTPVLDPVNAMLPVRVRISPPTV